MANVLVTGGARRLGAVIVRALAAHGHRVAIHCHVSRDEAEALAREIGGVVVVGDLADPVTPARLVADAGTALGGPVDGLVNSASKFDYDAPPHVSPDLIAAHMAVNLTAPVLLAQALAAQAGLGHGAIVNLLDQKLANPNPDFFAYTCSKHALAAATVMLAQALAPRVRVNAVAPGIALPSADQTHAEFDGVANRNLLERPLDIRAIGEAVAFLLASPAITGQTLYVDNGQRFVASARDVMFANRAPR